MRVVIAHLILTLLAACAENNFADVERQSGPVQESRPAKLGDCKNKPAPKVTWVAAPGAPIAVVLERAYHSCMRSYVALLRLEGKPGAHPVAVVRLERELIDATRRRAPTRTILRYSRLIKENDVRFWRLRWWEDMSDPGLRNLRLRLRSVHFTDGQVWKAPPWPRAAFKPSGKSKPKTGIGLLRDRLHAVNEKWKLRKAKKDRAKAEKAKAKAKAKAKKKGSRRRARRR